MKHFILYVNILIFFINCEKENGSVLDVGVGSKPTPYAKIIMFNVGQGDAILIVTPENKKILIDGGPPLSGYNTILPYFEYHGITTLDYIIVSHFHKDHIGGLTEIIGGLDGALDSDDDISIKYAIYDRGLEETDKTLLNDYLQTFGNIRREIELNEKFYVERNFNISILSTNCKTVPKSFDCEDENSRSTALLIQFNLFKFLSMGDLTGGGDNSLDLESIVGEITGGVSLLKVSHHGSKSSSNIDFLNLINPIASLISVGENNYGHPNCGVIDNLSRVNSDIYLTNKGSENCNSSNTKVVNDNIEIYVLDGNRMVIDDVVYELK